MHNKQKLEDSLVQKGGASAPYFERAWSIMGPVWGRIVVSLVFIIGVLALYFKHTIEGSSWMFSVINAAMVAIGFGLAVLSTAVLVKNASRTK